MSSRTLLPALAAVVLLTAGRVPASEALRKEVRTAIALPIKKLLEEEKQEAVSIGEFTGPAQFDTNAGPGLQQLIAEELTALKVSVERKANLSVKGRYAKIDDQQSPGRIVLKLTAEVFDRNDERKAEFHCMLDGVADMARMMGVTAQLPPADEPGAGQRRNGELGMRIEHPRAHIDGSKVSTAAGSLYAVELLVKANAYGKAEPRAPRLEGGEAYVAIERNELYEIRLYNSSKEEVGVTISIDGLDCFAFSEARDPKANRPRYTHYILPPGKPATVVGWHLRDTPPDNYASFLVTEYGKGASSRMVAQAQGKRGVITVTFAPAYEGKPRSMGDETGLGPPQSVAVQPVERSVGPVREVVSIRYAR